MNFTTSEILAIVESVKMKNTENEYHIGKLEMLFPDHSELYQHRVYLKRIAKREVYARVLQKITSILEPSSASVST